MSCFLDMCLFCDGPRKGEGQAFSEQPVLMNRTFQRLQAFAYQIIHAHNVLTSFNFDDLGKASIAKKTFLNRHCPYRSYPLPPAGQRATWSFFRPSKTTFKRVLRNQIPIENDDENGDDNGDNFYA